MLRRHRLLLWYSTTPRSAPYLKTCKLLGPWHVLLCHLKQISKCFRSLTLGSAWGSKEQVRVEHTYLSLWKRKHGVLLTAGLSPQTKPYFGVLQNRIVAIYSLDFLPWILFFSLFTYKVCRRMEKGFASLQNNPAKIGCNDLNPSAVDVAMSITLQWSLSKCSISQQKCNCFFFFYYYFFSKPSSESCLPSDSLKSISAQVSHRMCNDCWALSLWVR